MNPVSELLEESKTDDEHKEDEADEKDEKEPHQALIECCKQRRSVCLATAMIPAIVLFIGTVCANEWITCGYYLTLCNMLAILLYTAFVHFQSIYMNTEPQTRVQYHCVLLYFFWPFFISGIVIMTNVYACKNDENDQKQYVYDHPMITLFVTAFFYLVVVPMGIVMGQVVTICKKSNSLSIYESDVTCHQESHSNGCWCWSYDRTTDSPIQTCACICCLKTNQDQVQIDVPVHLQRHAQELFTTRQASILALQNSLPLYEESIENTGIEIISSVTWLAQPPTYSYQEPSAPPNSDIISV